MSYVGERPDLLAYIAALYFEDGLTQEEIARRTGYSRSAVSRLLTEARQRGIVEIRVNFPVNRARPLEHRIQEEFSLRECLVITAGSLDYPKMLRLLGRAGAAYLEEHLPDHGILGVSWGTAVYEIASALRVRYSPRIQVVQMIGALGGGDPLIDGPELARALAQTLGATYSTLNAPFIVEDAGARSALMADHNIMQAIEQAQRADFAIVGIGSVEPELSSFVRAGYLSADEVLAIQGKGAVGDICGSHFDITGAILDIDINRRIIGIELPRLCRSGCTVLGVAGGERKGSAILGALRGGFIDVLVTDAAAAQSLLPFVGKDPLSHHDPGRPPHAGRAINPEH